MRKLAHEMTCLSDGIRNLREHRRESLAQTRESVGELRQEARSAMDNARAALVEMARESRSAREQFLKDLRADVQRTRSEARGLRERFRRSLAQTGEAARSDRQAFVEDLNSRVQELRASLLHHRSVATEQSRRELQEFLSELQSDVRELRGGSREARQEMAQTSASKRAAFMSEIVESTTTLRDQVASDLKTARTAFFGPAPVELKVEEGRKRAERRHGRGQRKRTGRKQTQTKRATRRSDDLTAVSGIGPKMQQRLNEEAGIYTYAQLAAAEPENLCETFQGVRTATIRNVKRWAAEARKLAQQQ